MCRERESSPDKFSESAKVRSESALSDDFEFISCAEDEVPAWLEICGVLNSSFALLVSSQAVKQDRENVSAAKASVDLDANLIFIYDPH